MEKFRAGTFYRELYRELEYKRVRRYFYGT